MGTLEAVFPIIFWRPNVLKVFSASTFGGCNGFQAWRTSAPFPKAINDTNFLPSTAVDAKNSKDPSPAHISRLEMQLCRWLKFRPASMKQTQHV